MKLVERVPNRFVFELVDEILFKIDEPSDLIDLTIILTLLLYGRMMLLGESGSTDEFIDEWVMVLRRNIREFDGEIQ